MGGVSLYIVCSALCLALGSAANLPSYVKGCSRNEPDINACALKSGREAIPQFIDGDRKYRIPNLDPITITQLVVNEGVLGLKLTVNNAKLYGLRDVVLEDVDISFEKRKVRYQLFLPRAEVECEYDINGRILILPITGVGPGNITLLNVRLNYTYEYDLVTKKDGLEYFRPMKSHLDFDTSRIYVKLENLFNGNKLLGDQMNDFMEENWRELKNDLGPIISEAISETMRVILQNIFETVDYDKAFPDVPPAQNN